MCMSHSTSNRMIDYMGYQKVTWVTPSFKAYSKRFSEISKNFFVHSIYRQNYLLSIAPTYEVSENFASRGRKTFFSQSYAYTENKLLGYCWPIDCINVLQIILN